MAWSALVAALKMAAMLAIRILLIKNLAGSFSFRQGGYHCTLKRLHSAQEIVHFARDTILGITILFLQDAFQFGAAAIDAVEVILCEVTPFLLNLAADLFPLA